MSGPRVLVTGVGGRLGHLIAERMAARADVDVVVAVAGAAGPALAGVEVVNLSEEYDGIAELIRGRSIDTIIHADRRWSLSGVGRTGAGQHVIATMQLASAAAHRKTTVRRVVMASSTRVYEVSSRAARLHPESEPLHPRVGSLAASLVEAEGFVRNLATTNPNLSASILRLADLAGPGTNDPLSAVLAGPVIPAIWGFDPSVQLLHLDDAVAALEHSVDHDLAGFYNVAAAGLLRWRRAARMTRKLLIELPVGPTQPLASLLRWFYKLNGDDDLLAVLRFGRGAATDAFTRSGFLPARTTAQCVPGLPTYARHVA